MAVYRALSLLGTLLLMFGVITLANASLELQIAFAAAYMILNAAYWIVAALPPLWHWDLSSYKIHVDPQLGGEENPSFTAARWKTIAITGTTGWVRMTASVAPVGQAWDEWLKEAGDQAVREPYKEDKEKKGYWRTATWDSEEALSQYLKPKVGVGAV